MASGRRLAALALAAMALVVAPAKGVAQAVVPVEDQAKAAPAEERTRLATPIEIARLADLAAQRLRVRVVYDPGKLVGQVIIRAPDGVDDAQLWRLLNTELAARNQTTIHADDGTFSVVSLEEAARKAPREGPVSVDVALAPVSPLSPGYRAVIVRLSSVSASQAVERLRAAGGDARSTPAGVVVQPQGTDAVLVGDLAPRLQDSLRALAAFDIAENAIDSEEVNLSNVSAAGAIAFARQAEALREQITGESTPGELLASPTERGVLIFAPRRAIGAWKELLARADYREPLIDAVYQPPAFAIAQATELVRQLVEDGRGQATGVATSGAKAGPEEKRSRVLLDPLSGVLLVRTTAARHKDVQSLMDRLAEVPGEVRRPVRTIAVRNRPVGELVETLERLISAGVLGEGVVSGVGGRAPRPGVGAGVNFAELPEGATALRVASAPGDAATARVPERAGADRATAREAWITLTADEPTNTIVAVGSQQVLDELSRLIERLDVAQSQVMLEAMLVSLTDSDVLSLGVELERLRISGDIRVRLSSLFGLSSPVTIDGEPSRSVGDPSGFSGVVLSPGDFSIIVRAIQTVNRGRTVSLPRVLVLNNQQASFNGVLQQPFAASFAAGNVSTPTTSFGGTSDAGTQLSIRPQISESDYLLLDYNISISQFTGTAASVNLPPPRQVNSVQSIARIPDGYAVVVGGLEVTTDADGATQIPILGNIPLIGDLFKNQTRSTTRSRFFVFIRASVLRGPSLEPLRYVSDQAGIDAGVEPGWPRSEPQPMR